MSNSIIEYVKAHKKIYCYGAGHFGKVVRIFLQEQGIDIAGFVISGRAEKSHILDIPVVNLGNLKIEDDLGIIISVGNKYRHEIISTLNSNGFSDYLDVDEYFFRDMENRLQFKYTYQIDKYICVLYYHRVCDLTRDTWNLSVPPKLFEEHIKFIKEHYRILRFEDDWDDIHEKVVVITFDDGYADNFEFALPILEKYEVPATVFVAIDPGGEFWSDALDRIVHEAGKTIEEVCWAGQKFPVSTSAEQEKTCYALHPFFKEMLPALRSKNLQELAASLNARFEHDNKESRLLSDRELRALSQSPYITIGGHTVTHTSLAVEPASLQWEEIHNSKAHIESVIGKPIEVFSYPFGTREDFTPESENAVRACGYKKAATTICGLADGADAFQIPRVWIPGNCSVSELRYILGRTWYLG